MEYWNPSGSFGRKMSEALGLRKGDRQLYAWDVWMIYAPEVTWSAAAPPHPKLLMHQLSGLMGKPNLPFLDSKVLAEEARALLANLPPSGALQ